MVEAGQELHVDSEYVLGEVAATVGFSYRKEGFSPKGQAAIPTSAVCQPALGVREKLSTALSLMLLCSQGLGYGVLTARAQVVQTS